MCITAGNMLQPDATLCWVQDHERLIEKKRYELEHHPVQKQVCISVCEARLVM
jgi:hypothetical protein